MAGLDDRDALETSFKAAGGFAGLASTPFPQFDEATGQLVFGLGQVAKVFLIPEGDGYRLKTTLSSEILNAIENSGIKIVT